MAKRVYRHFGDAPVSSCTLSDSEEASTKPSPYGPGIRRWKDTEVPQSPTSGNLGIMTKSFIRNAMR